MQDEEDGGGWNLDGDGWSRRGVISSEGEARVLVLVEGRGVDEEERPDEAEDAKQDPTQEVVADPEAQPRPLRRQPLVHQRHRRARHAAGGGGKQRRGGAHRRGGPFLGGRAPHPPASRPRHRRQT